MSQLGSILPSVVSQVVALLRANVSIAARLMDMTSGDIKVWNNVPVGTVPPYLWVLSHEEADLPKKLGHGHYGRTCTIKVVPVSRHRGTKEIDELGSLVMEALERQPLTIPDYSEAGIVWDSTQGPIVTEAEGGPQFSRDILFRAMAR